MKALVQIDRLPAISGLVECFELATGLGGYVAGLCEEDLIDGLLWSVRRTWTSTLWTPELEGYRAPWWSRRLTKHWTDLPNSHTQPSILGLETTPHGSDPRGRLAGGRLTIEGVIKIVTQNGCPLR
jgi:hypothetical protein